MIKFPWQKGWRKEREQQALALQKAQADLDALNKSKDEGEEVSAIAQLEKALLEFSDLAPLQKSKEDEEAEAREKEEREKEEALEKAREDEAREQALEKARNEGELEEELVKASLLFGDLQKSVDESAEMTGEGLDLLAKGLGSNTDLLIKIGGAVVGLQKSFDQILGLIGTMPAKASGVDLGFQKSRDEDGDRTSVDEARSILQKARTEGEVLPAGLLIRLDTQKDVGIIPATLREKYNIKA
jgi:hypothetical protein